MDQLRPIEEYINDVRKEIYNLSPSDEFLRALREDLIEYRFHNPDCTFDDLVHQFGSPEMVAKDFLDNTIDSSPQKLAHKKKKRLIVIIILVALLVAIILYCIAISMQTQGAATDVITIENDDITEEVIE